MEWCANGYSGCYCGIIADMVVVVEVALEVVVAGTVKEQLFCVRVRA